MSKPAVIELQEETMKTNSSISSLIRMAYVIAKKLKLTEFGEWLQYELNGYQDYKGKEWPPYRIVSGELKGWNPIHGWIPVILYDTELHDLICNQKVVNAISSFEDMVNSKSDIMMIPLNPKTNTLIAKGTSFNTKYSVFIDRMSVQSICDTVRNYVLEWSLKLEEEGILGENMRFNNEEKEKAKGMGYTFNYFYGDINHSQIQQNTTSSNQSISFETNKDEINNLLKELKDNYNHLGLEEQKTQEIKDNITKLEQIVDKNDYGNRKIVGILISLKNILEGTVSSLAASGLLYMIEQLLGK